MFWFYCHLIKQSIETKMNFPTGHAINGTYPINDCGIDIFRFSENTRISFEIFPPKNQNQKAQLTKAVKKLKLNSPDFFSLGI